MASADFVIKQNDTYPSLYVDLTDGGIAFDSSGIKSVKFNFMKDGVVFVLDGAITAEGVKWDPTIQVTAEVGMWRFEVELTFLNDKHTTLPDIGYYTLLVSKELI